MRFSTVRRGSAAVAALLAGVLALSACGSSGGAETVTVTQTATQEMPSVTAPNLTDVLGSTAESAAPATSVSATVQAGDGVRVAATPAFGSTNVPPNNPVTVTIFSATITSLTMTGNDGSTVTGKVSADKKTWTSAERLNYNTKYTFTGAALAALDGKSVPISGALSTVNPTKTLGIQINMGEGQVVGVAAPIIITFLGQVTDRAAAEKALTVTTSQGAALQGNWAWVQDEDFQNLGYKQSQVHWRPTKSSMGTPSYWPSGTQVTVTANMKGVSYGGGAWGRDDLTRKFTVRTDGIVVKADVSSHQLVVLVNGDVVYNWAVAYGKESVPGRSTLNGIHVVTNRYPQYAMCNPKFDYCNSEEKWAVRINNNGEFIHENLKAATAFGKENVSHGCINMDTIPAETFYNLAKYGDPVEVTNSLAPDGSPGPSISPADALYDWIYSPTDWKSLSALG